MKLDNQKFNVMERGQHTLFMLTAKKPDGTKRDPELVRAQIANMLGVDLRRVTPNHDYEGKPKDAAYVFRFKGKLPRNLRRPITGEGKHLFVAADLVLNMLKDEPAPKKVAKGMQPMPGLPDEEDEAQSEGDSPVVAPITTNEKALLELLKGQQDIMRHIQYLYEQMGLEAIKRR